MIFGFLETAALEALPVYHQSFCPIVQGPECQPVKLETEITTPLGYQSFLTKPGYNYLTIFYDDGHCPSAVRAGEWPPVVSFRWLERDAFATAQADHP